MIQTSVVGSLLFEKKKLPQYFYFASLTAPKTILPILLNRTLVFRGVPIRERGSISASGFGPGGPNPLADLDRGVQIRGGSKSAVTPALSPVLSKPTKGPLFSN